MKITVIGTGYVGLVTGACLAEVGNQVFCVDVDQRKINVLNAGGVPIHEPGLLDMVTRNRNAGRLTFSNDIAASVEFGDFQFIAVGTPPDEDGSADLQYVVQAARNIGRLMNSFKVIVDKSTVPPGTADIVTSALRAELVARGVDCEFSVVSNPEFLKEGAALEDFMRPDRIIVGCNEDLHGQRARALMKSLYLPFQRNRDRTIFMDIRSAELTKYAANAMLATRISFMNEIANLAEVLGADIELIRTGIGSDPRIGYDFLYAGAGYGGSCFPKDVQALLRASVDAKVPSRILEAVDKANTSQKGVIGSKVLSHYGGDLSGVTIALWGLAFKPNTDDMREAPSRTFIREVLERGGNIQAFDPVAIEEARRVIALDLKDQPHLATEITFSDSAEDALINANLLVIMTEWKAFRSPDFALMARTLKDALIIDGRNLYEPAAVASHGLRYQSIGRPTIDLIRPEQFASRALETSHASLGSSADS